MWGSKKSSVDQSELGNLCYQNVTLIIWLGPNYFARQHFPNFSFHLPKL